MSSVALQIAKTGSGKVNVGASVIFELPPYVPGNLTYDTILINQDIDYYMFNSPIRIGYNSVTGTITLNETGKYHINWWLTLQFPGTSNGAVFALWSSQGDLFKSKQAGEKSNGKISGSGVIEVGDTPVMVSIINAGEQPVCYCGDNGIQAEITFTKEEDESGHKSNAAEKRDNGEKANSDGKHNEESEVEQAKLSVFAKISDILKSKNTCVRECRPLVCREGDPLTSIVFGVSGLPGISFFTGEDAKGKNDFLGIEVIVNHIDPSGIVTGSAFSVTSDSNIVLEKSIFTASIELPVLDMIVSIVEQEYKAEGKGCLFPALLGRCNLASNITGAILGCDFYKKIADENPDPDKVHTFFLTSLSLQINGFTILNNISGYEKVCDESAV